MMSHFLRNRTSIMPLYMDDVSTLSVLIFKRLSNKSEQSQSTSELLLSINETLWGIILKHWVFKWMWLANTNVCRSILFVAQTSNLEIKNINESPFDLHYICFGTMPVIHLNFLKYTGVVWSWEGGGDVILPIETYSWRLRPKWTPFSGLRYMERYGFH